MRGTHLCQHLIQPLQWSVQVDLNPAWGTCDILAMIFSSPALQRDENQYQRVTKGILFFILSNKIQFCKIHWKSATFQKNISVRRFIVQPLAEIKLKSESQQEQICSLTRYNSAILHLRPTALFLYSREFKLNSIIVQFHLSKK